MHLCLVLPPLTQLNTPYPSTAYLARFLHQRGIAAGQRDLGLELALALYSSQGLAEIFDHLEALEELPELAWRALALRDQYCTTIDAVIRFLQGRDRTLATRILETPFLPVGPRLDQVNLEAFGPLATDDAARHLSTLHLADLADLVHACVAPGFELIRYQAHLAQGFQAFGPLQQRLTRTTLVDRHLDQLADTITGDVVGISIPFPGNLYSALRIGQRLRARGIHVVMGGGYVNTELRGSMPDELWNFTDALTYDDGEGPLLATLELLDGGPDRRHRTRTAQGDHDAAFPPVPPAFAPHYEGLDLEQYLQLVDTLNPTHRLWADGRWNKLTLAHGCYWKQCAFCDIQLDYVANYRPHRAQQLADAIDEVTDATGQSGFHFVDEAAPPRLLRDLSLELLARGRSVTWWGNIRFEPTFTPDLCRLLAAAGLVAVTGGLEVASDRVLGKMKKGISIDKATRSAQAFREAGILVHAYLMYGFPTQSLQETIDAMEVVRQLFHHDVLTSGFWHRFVLTRHSGIAQAPQDYDVRIVESAGNLTHNDLEHIDAQGTNHERFDDVLPLALESWMQGRGLDAPLRSWFEQARVPGPVPAPSEPPDRIARTLEVAALPPRDSDRVVWLGGMPLLTADHLVLHHSDGVETLHGTHEQIQWLAELLSATTPDQPAVTLQEARTSFPGSWDEFADRWNTARRAGLVLV